MIAFAIFAGILLVLTASGFAQSDTLPSFAHTDIRYMRLVLDVDPADSFIYGDANICFDVRNSDVYLPIKLELSNAFASVAVFHNGTPLPYIHNGNNICISAPSHWQSSDSIQIVYHGNPSESGLGSVHFDNHDGSPIFWTLSEPYGARDWFPCKQELSDKIDSSCIIVKCPAKYRAASIGILRREYVDHGIRISEWHHNYPCAYYLIAVAVSNYKVYSDWVTLHNGDSIEIVNYVYPERYEQWKRKTCRLAPALRMLCDTFGIYPFIKEKYGHAQFGWHGGMEHQTMSFVSTPDLDLLIHELAHQWFGNAITANSWSDIFLHEGFATYCEMLASELGIGQSCNTVQWRRASIAEICHNHSNSLYCKDTTDANTIFNHSISYNKGAMMLHMLRKEMGDAHFFKCIRNYVEKYKYINTSANAFFATVTEETGRNYDWFVSQWLYGAGMPSFNIKWQQSSSYLIDFAITQTSSHPSVPFFKCKVPLMIYGSNGEKLLVRLNNYTNKQHFTINPGGILVTRIEFDPYCDIISYNNTISHEPKQPTSNIVINKDKNNTIKVSFPDTCDFNWYILKSTTSSDLSFRHQITGNRRIEIHTSDIPEGQYILILEGTNYYSTLLYISRKKKKKAKT